MALNVNKIHSFLDRINNADSNTFSSAIKHLFDYLTKEASENPILMKYEKDKIGWGLWPGITLSSFGVPWRLPDSFEDTKSLCYSLYATAAQQNDDGTGISHTLFSKSHMPDNIHQFNSQFMEYFRDALQDIVKAEKVDPSSDVENNNANKIFIIHGHDEAMKKDVQLLLSRAELDDVVLHERPDIGRTIIDKLIEESSPACYAIALLSPDDITGEGLYRARQNVILEIGYFLGKLGKSKVRLLKKGGIEIPTDLSGILYTHYDESGSWKIRLLKEMKEVGIEIDIEKSLKKF